MRKVETIRSRVRKRKVRKGQVEVIEYSKDERERVKKRELVEKIEWLSI
jgi:hypothetical protein